jgi:hypothetical protein
LVPCGPLNKAKYNELSPLSDLMYRKSSSIKLPRDFIKRFKEYSFFSDQNIIIKGWIYRNNRKLTLRIYKYIYYPILIFIGEAKVTRIVSIF